MALGVLSRKLIAGDLRCAFFFVSFFCANPWLSSSWTKTTGDKMDRLQKEPFVMNVGETVNDFVLRMNVAGVYFKQIESMRSI